NKRPSTTYSCRSTRCWSPKRTARSPFWGPTTKAASTTRPRLLTSCDPRNESTLVAECSPTSAAGPCPFRSVAFHPAILQRDSRCAGLGPLLHSRTALPGPPVLVATGLLPPSGSGAVDVREWPAKAHQALRLSCC